MSSSRKFAGRPFQTRGPATAKLLSPNVLCVRGTAHDLSVDEQSRRRGPSETKCMSSARYEGAWPDNDEKTKHVQVSLGNIPKGNLMGQLWKILLHAGCPSNNVKACTSSLVSDSRTGLV